MEDIRTISSNNFRPNARIHQGDVIHNYSSEPPRAYHDIPFPENRGIVPRPELLAAINELLPPSYKGNQSAALFGLGGSGQAIIHAVLAMAAR